MISDLKSGGLQKAVRDFRYLLNHGYPRKTSLELVGNRYSLSFDQRHLLHRGIFSEADAKARKRKKISFQKIRNKKLAIDGYNILITVEAALSGRSLILSNDGFIRDISGLSGSFKKTKTTDKAIRLILDKIREAKPHHTLFLFDAPISRSGLLANEVRERLKKEHLSGDAMAVKVPEKILIGFPGIVATSDTAIIDQSQEVFDLAGHIIKNRIKPGSLLTVNLVPT
ncbi:MAG TPA: DUF434 domain-containing protein [Thermodesulfobacteriota bacterium]|nr:DUF434 domain-containing protein [Thermodesulfobacteriota bacterium]